MTDLFAHFTQNEWIYESVKLNDYIKQLSPEDAKEFQIDVKTINWETAVWRYGYGLQKYYFKQDVYQMTDMGLLIPKNPTP